MRNKLIYTAFCLLIMVFTMACDPTVTTRHVLENQTDYDVHFFLEKPDTTLFWNIEPQGELQFQYDQSIGTVEPNGFCGWYGPVEITIIIPELDSLVLNYDSLNKAVLDYYEYTILYEDGYGGGDVECRKILVNADL